MGTIDGFCGLRSFMERNLFHPCTRNCAAELGDDCEMSRSVIVAIGGTGQLVLHYYAQLYQIGSVPDAFHAVVIDSDKLMGSLETLGRFWEMARLAHPEPLSVPQLDYLPVAQNVQGQVLRVVAGADLSTSSAAHPAEAFFDSISLEQDVKEGLYARPALSAIMQTDWGRFPLATLTGFQRALVVTSLIGGTGGGLIAPLLNQLASRIRKAAAIEQPRLRAVFFGEYFQLKSNAPVRDASTRYASNKLLVARCLKEMAPNELEHFIFIEPKTPVDRETAKESSAVNLPWPSETHPLWMGLSSLEELRTNTTWPNAVEFKDKERDVSLRDSGRDRTALSHGVAVARTIAYHSILEKLPREPWLQTFYGRGLPTLVAQAYTVAKRRPALRLYDVKRFARELQSQYSVLWNEVGSVFPAVSGAEENPAGLREVHWGEVRSEVPELSDSREKLVTATSALILYRALRGGLA